MTTATTITVPPRARQSYLAISSIIRHHLSIAQRPQPAQRRHSSTYDRNDFTNHGFTGFYEAGAPTSGPLADASNIGAPRITPLVLKQHLDAFVVGQERAKKTLATAVYNHYQRIQELERRDEEEEERLAQEERRRIGDLRRHPVEGREHELKKGIAVPSLTKPWLEDEFPGQQATVNVWPDGQAERSSPFHPQRQSPVSEEYGRHVGSGRSDGGMGAVPGPGPPRSSSPSHSPLHDPSPLTIEKSNILMLGPSGVGKTLMAKTLARVLEVPLSISDCTPFTQAGYIGEDADVCVQRLLAAANYDVARAERGIICLDEIDKIATARVSHGKDVSGEGVQQALLKIIEGTTLQIQAKQERGASGSTSSRSGGGGGGGSGGWPTNSPLSGGNMSQQGSSSGGGGGKNDVYNVRTDNILFICAGAFNGLHKMVLDRISKGSIGFGATVRAPHGSSSSSADGEATPHETVFEGEDELFKQHLPFHAQAPPTSARDSLDNDPDFHISTTPQLSQNTRKPKRQRYNTLDLVTPTDLQKFGLIPELIGRLPITTALHSLDTAALVSVLTEPRNSLLKQYQQLLGLSSIDLRFTTPALHAIAATAARMSTGARGLRTVMEGLLADAMFETPGSGVRFVLIDREVAARKKGAVYFGRGEGARVRMAVAREEEEWEEECRREREEEESDEGDLWTKRARNNSKGGAARTFEEYREKASAAGF
ncbi:hypothetical protein K431DRAFT_284315 [Polychaeton citri CBS 116435]|uniref:ClpX, ATPase regulatory subunit n=1 Tax=Polychaeton citri CBS 116435 TaxID=1314669 RepID=A0A9P4UPT0_9PEZI|nr:hypothetical protein K431DRAFT_284315 [Polychaeton citri CBS 116435]